jgi:hypothetical protein
MTAKHFIVDSQAIEDTDASVLEWVNKYVEALKTCEGQMVFMRVPLEIQRGIKDFGTPRTFAKVYARWSVEIPEPDRRSQNDTPVAVQRVVMSWFPP